MATKKQKRILRNRLIAGGITLLSGYILIVNNSLDFLIKFGINVNQNAVAFIGFIIIFFWAIWKAQMGEI
ncbi:MAG: hypothetical protein ACOCV1_01615 [Bacillota bacterium]